MQEKNLEVISHPVRCDDQDQIIVDTQLGQAFHYMQRVIIVDTQLGQAFHYMQHVCVCVCVCVCMCMNVCMHACMRVGM